MAKKKTFIFKDEYQKSHKIMIRNKTLGCLIPLTKSQVLTMAKNGKLNKSQLDSIFVKPAPNQGE